jgi:hypothetical protein
MKRNTPIEKTLPDIVTVVLGEMKQQRINKSQLAKRCGWSSGTITGLFKKRNWTTAELKQIGAVLKTDLFVYYLNTPVDGMVPASTLQEAVTEIAELKTQLTNMEKQNLVLLTENNLMKKLLENRG